MDNLPIGSRLRKPFTINSKRFREDTAHLTDKEFMALCRLTLHELLTGELPAGSEHLRRIADMGADEWYEMTPFLHEALLVDRRTGVRIRQLEDWVRG
jgi:uncharacterized protein YdaU (DUF1376 family)